MGAALYEVSDGVDFDRVEEQEPVAEKESVRTSPRAHTQQLKTEAAPPPAKAAAPRKAPSKTAPPKRGKQGPVKTIKKERRPARKESYKVLAPTGTLIFPEAKTVLCCLHGAVRSDALQHHQYIATILPALFVCAVCVAVLAVGD